MKGQTGVILEAHGGVQNMSLQELVYRYIWLWWVCVNSIKEYLTYVRIKSAKPYTTTNPYHTSVRCSNIWIWWGTYGKHPLPPISYQSPIKRIINPPNTGAFSPDYPRFYRQHFQKFPDFFMRQFWILGMLDGCFDMKMHCFQ